MSATPAYGPPYGPPFGPPPKRTRWGLIFGLLAGGLVLLCCCGGAVFFGLIAGQTEPARTAAQNYVNAVIAGDDAKAMQYVCTASGSQASHDNFTEYVKSKGVTGSEVTDTKVTLWNLSWKATVQMDLTVGAGGTESLELPMAKQNGKWKVCN